MAERMIGLDRLIKARSRGYKPAGWVSVDVGSIGYQSMLRQALNVDGAPRMLALWSVEADKPGALYVLAHPGESVRMADWAWCIGLRVQIDGDPNGATSPGVQPGVERSSRNGLLLLDVLAQDFDWCATTRRGEVGRRPQDAPALQPRMEVSEFLAQQAR